MPTKLDEFLSQPLAVSNTCETCRSDPKTAEVIERYWSHRAEAKKAGERTHGIRRFHEFLRSEYDYKLGYTALYNHLRYCKSGKKRGSKK
jgi:hypothetical protein